MCYEKVQRILMASVIALGSVLVYLGYPAGFFFLGFVVVMATIWGLTDFCPSLTILRRLGMRSCYAGRGLRKAA